MSTSVEDELVYGAKTITRSLVHALQDQLMRYGTTAQVPVTHLNAVFQSLCSLLTGYTSSFHDSKKKMLMVSLGKLAQLDLITVNHAVQLSEGIVVGSQKSSAQAQECVELVEAGKRYAPIVKENDVFLSPFVRAVIKKMTVDALSGIEGVTAIRNTLMLCVSSSSQYATRQDQVSADTLDTLYSYTAEGSRSMDRWISSLLEAELLTVPMALVLSYCHWEESVEGTLLYQAWCEAGERTTQQSAFILDIILAHWLRSPSTVIDYEALTAISCDPENLVLPTGIVLNMVDTKTPITSSDRAFSIGDKLIPVYDSIST